MFVDSHCHLDFPELAADLPSVLARMAEARVSHAMCISVKLETVERVLAIAAQAPNLYATVGVHPDDPSVQEPDEATLIALAAREKVVAIGETGLDYHWHSNAEPGALDWQRERFRVHIRAARAVNKPLVIHTRKSAEDTLRILEEERAAPADGGPGGIFHCFTENRAIAERALDLGFHISFSGIVTFKTAAELREVVAWMPLDRMLIETDSPYLAPVPYRGKTNEPSYVPHVAAEIARVRQMPIEEIARITSDNFFRLIGNQA
ncbi:TatD family hydrolase [Derxia gummosa]|uniref:TatD family hydrolase n=1 Tax=Derxia gummosa DSM 723 TaxID=1121388 RepID=A0A8B6X4H0_9BURK|nr:TatD family hydrolase [Derxia gummosa]